MPSRGSTLRSAAPRRSGSLWAGWGCLALAGLGLAVSAYLLVEHLNSANTLACPETAAVNCLRVTTSEQSTILGIPWAVIGVVYFTAMAALVMPFAWRGRSTTIARLRVMLAAAGAVSVLYLVFVELFVINAICLWCTAAHAAALALFGVVTLTFARTYDDV
jgi:uncharacterized membrane protein